MSTDLYLDLTAKAQRHPMLYHYTSLSSLRLMLKNQSLKLNRLDKVNDPEENNRVSSLWNTKLFVACFTHTLDNAEYFFSNYGNVRITFTPDFSSKYIYSDSELTNCFQNYKTDNGNASHNTYSGPSDWAVFDVSWSDVYYTDDLRKHIFEDEYSSNAGLIKLKNGTDYNNISVDWSIETETRVRVAIRPIGCEFYHRKQDNSIRYYLPPFESVFITLPPIVNIELSPGADTTTRAQLKELLRSL